MDRNPARELEHLLLALMLLDRWHDGCDWCDTDTKLIDSGEQECQELQRKLNKDIEFEPERQLELELQFVKDMARVTLRVSKDWLTLIGENHSDTAWAPLARYLADALDGLSK